MAGEEYVYPGYDLGDDKVHSLSSRLALQDSEMG